VCCPIPHNSTANCSLTCVVHSIGSVVASQGDHSLALLCVPNPMPSSTRFSLLHFAFGQPGLELILRILLSRFLLSRRMPGHPFFFFYFFSFSISRSVFIHFDILPPCASCFNHVRSKCRRESIWKYDPRNPVRQEVNILVKSRPQAIPKRVWSAQSISMDMVSIEANPRRYVDYFPLTGDLLPRITQQKIPILQFSPCRDTPGFTQSIG